LSLDNNALVLVALFAARPLIAVGAFPIVVYALLVGLAAFNLSSVRTPKLGGNWYYAVLAYALCASAWFGWQLLAARG
jgi:CDP-diacylglycerol--serine O-phosphatidyltransferase